MIEVLAHCAPESGQLGLCGRLAYRSVRFRAPFGGGVSGAGDTR
jgi:hypothetical protein